MSILDSTVALTSQILAVASILFGEAQKGFDRLLICES
jgi:hypothetical protein